MKPEPTRPCIRVTPKDASRPAFNVCGSRSTDFVNTRNVMILSNESINAWLCAQCADRYRKPIYVGMPADVLEKVRAETPTRESRSPDAKRRARNEKNRSRNDAIRTLTDA